MVLDHVAQRAGAVVEGAARAHAEAFGQRDLDVGDALAAPQRLEQRIAEGTFREDLFYRINVFPIRVPALRERVEDIPAMVWRFVDEFSRAFGKRIDSISKESLAALQQYSWPGNVRELRNVVERWAALGRLDRTMFDPIQAANGADDDLALLPYHEARKIVLDRFEEKYLPRVLARANGVMARAAELAEVARPSFYRMMERIKPSK